MKILLVDNFDSFTFNLYQYLCELKCEVTVLRNNEVDPSTVIGRDYTHIVLSPGPGTPDGAGVSLELIKKSAGRIPLLGVCLGHQAIGQIFGGEVVRAPRQMHGKVSKIYHDKKGVFLTMKQGFLATRYHSLIVKKKNLPRCLEISARTSDGVIMGLRHKEYRIEGVQFHPESFLTQNGKTILKNFIQMKEHNH